MIQDTIIFWASLIFLVGMYFQIRKIIQTKDASSFSYTAALLSKGLIFYKKFWHTGANKWKHF